MARGRPRTRDPRDVLDKVMITFWKHGYENTSLNDLVAASGMAKPGLYANFGDKEDLYAKALASYVEKFAASMLETLNEAGLSAHDSLKAYFNRVASTASSPDGTKGCFVALSLVEVDAMPPGLKDYAQEMNRHRLNWIRDRLQAAYDAGEIPTDADVDALAFFFSAQVITLSTLARSGATQAELENLIRVALHALPAPKI